MPQTTYKDLEPTREAKEVFERWLAYLDREVGKHRTPELRQELVLDNLHQLLLGAPIGGRLNFQLESELAYNTLRLSLDPKNITLQAEYTEGLDEEKYAPLKPLIYFWQMFDRSPVGLNHWLGFRFRAMLGGHIFAKIGKNVQIYPGVEFTFGYNLTLEDECVIRRHVVLDDCKELVVKKGACIAEFTTLRPEEQQGGEESAPPDDNAPGPASNEG